MRQIFIYGLFHPSRPDLCMYVGKSTDVKRRYQEHFGNPLASLETWIKDLKLSKLKPILKVLEIVDGKNWRKAEAFWIESKRGENSGLLNIQDGGQGPTSGSKLTLEQKKNRSISAFKQWEKPGRKSSVSSQSVERWKDESYEISTSQKIKEACSKPEARERNSENRKKEWAKDPTRRLKQAERMRNSWATGKITVRSAR